MLKRFSDQFIAGKQPVAATISRKYMGAVFFWMFLALSISSFVAILFAAIPALREFMFLETIKGLHLTSLGRIVILSPILFVMAISAGFQRFSLIALTILFVVFSVIMGACLSVWLWLYTETSVLGCFAAAAGMFGVMAILGYTTDKDLSRFGSILYMGLIGMVIAMMVNFLLQSHAIYYLTSFIGVAIFTGLTAVNMQRLKRIGSGIEYEGISTNETQKLALMGALQLYLNFLNIFLGLMSMFGQRRK